MSKKGIRQRILVNKMDLFNLYKEVSQIRNEENKKCYFARFRALLKDAEFIEFNVIQKKTCHEQGRKEGGNDER